MTGIQAILINRVAMIANAMLPVAQIRPLNICYLMVFSILLHIISLCHFLQLYKSFELNLFLHIAQ